jgi:hypothetical protein
LAAKQGHDDRRADGERRPVGDQGARAGATALRAGRRLRMSAYGCSRRWTACDRKGQGGARRVDRGCYDYGCGLGHQETVVSRHEGHTEAAKVRLLPKGKHDDQADSGRAPAHWPCPRHLIETTARPLLPHPRHRSRALRSSPRTILNGLSTAFFDRPR